MSKRGFHGVLLVMTVLFFYACNTQKKSATLSEQDKKPELIISYYQTPGFSPEAPEYKIDLYDNHQMFLDAKKNLDKKGKYMRTLSEKEYNQLVSAFLEADYFKFQDEYTSSITDLPTRYITFSHKGQTKKIKDYHGAPEELKELEFMVQSFLDRVGWEKMQW